MEIPPRPTVVRARSLRRRMTLPEVLLWKALRADAALKFRRQHPIGPYVLDFYCATARLAVEVDGAAHEMGHIPARDERRDAWLAAKSITVMRIPARDVLRDLEAAVRGIHAAFPSTIPAQGRDGPPPRAGEDL